MIGSLARRKTYHVGRSCMGFPSPGQRACQFRNGWLLLCALEQYDYPQRNATPYPRNNSKLEVAVVSRWQRGKTRSRRAILTGFTALGCPPQEYYLTALQERITRTERTEHRLQLIRKLILQHGRRVVVEIRGQQIRWYINQFHRDTCSREFNNYIIPLTSWDTSPRAIYSEVSILQTP